MGQNESTGSTTSRNPEKSQAPIASSKARSGEFGRVFDYFDENSDGKISPVELRNYMLIAGEEMTVEEAETVVVSNDSDGDGLLGFEDFVKMVAVDGDEKKRYHKEAFRVYEMEGRGCITPESLRKVLRRLGERKTMEECRKMIRQFDVDGNGVLSFEEFSLMMQ